MAVLGVIFFGWITVTKFFFCWIYGVEISLELIYSFLGVIILQQNLFCIEFTNLYHLGYFFVSYLIQLFWLTYSFFGCRIIVLKMWKDLNVMEKFKKVREYPLMILLMLLFCLLCSIKVELVCNNCNELNSDLTNEEHIQANNDILDGYNLSYIGAEELVYFDIKVANDVDR